MHDLQDQQTQYSNMGSRKKHNSLIQRLGILVIVFFLVVLVSSIAIVFYSLRHNNGGSTSTGAPGASHEIATPATPTSSPVHVDGPIGKIVYSTKTSPMDGPDVLALGWSPDSKRVGVGTLSAHSWDAATGGHVVSYGAARSGSVLDITWSPDGQRVAVTAVFQGVQIYDAISGVLLTTYSGSSQLATSSKTGGYMYSRQPLSGGSGAGVTAWSPDGQLMATSFFGSYGNIVQVWNTTTGRLVCTYRQHADRVGSLSWSPDGKYIASTSIDGSTQVWNASTGQRKHDFENNQRCNDGVAWSPDGKTIAYLQCDQVKIVNPLTGELLMTHSGPHDSWGLSDLAWSPDGKSIASAGDHIELWDVTTGKTYYTFSSNPSAIRVLAWSPNGNDIVSATALNSPEATSSVIQVWVAK